MRIARAAWFTASSPEAQKFFDQGVTMLFGFNHEEAERSFARAAELDRRAHARAAQAAFGDRVFERLRVPARDPLGDRLHVLVAAEQRQRAIDLPAQQWVR